MSLNLSCLITYPDVPLIPLIANKSNNLIHSIYKGDGHTLISKFSSLITEKLFSSNDLELLLLKNSPRKLLSLILIYSTSSIIVNGSKSIMIKSFNNLLNNYYYIEELNIIINNINEYFNELSDFIVNDENLKNFFIQFLISYNDIIHDLMNLNKRICNFISENDIQIEQNILNNAHQEFYFFIQLLNEQISNKINLTLLTNNQEEKIQSFISLISILTLFIIILITIIPLILLILITLNYVCFHSNDENNRIKNRKFQNPNTPQYINVQQFQSSHFHDNNQHRSRTLNRHRRNTIGERSSSFPTNNINLQKLEHHHSFLCSIRISFGFIIIFLIILCFISGLLYGVDLFNKSLCRVVHYEQSFLISSITDNFIQSIGDFDVNTTFNNIINNCKNKIHFSKIFFDEFSNQLNDRLIPIIKNLNENIYKQFSISIKMINVSSELNLLNNLANLAGLTDIQNRIIIIENNFNQIDKIFRQILEHNYQLSIKFLTETLNEFEIFLKNVIESTIDSCPLPMNNILEIDQLICHETANIINGLWLKIFLFMFSVLFGLCIFGICIYKRLI